MPARIELAPGELLARITAAIGLLDAGDIDSAERAALVLCDDFPRLPDGFALYARCAGARPDWPLALARWLVCEERFAADPRKWRVGLAYAYLNTGRLADAERVFSAELAMNPTHPAALAGQAMVLGKTAPERAGMLWRALSACMAGPPKPEWQVSRSRALVECGQTEQAITILNQVVDDDPGHRAAFAMLPDLLIATGKRAGIAADLERGRWRAGGGAPPLERLRLQRWLGDLSGARVSLLAALEAARTVTDLNAVLPALPGLFQAFERGEAWRALRARATAVLPPDAAETICLQMRVDIALRDHDTFLRRLDASPSQPEPWNWRFSRLAATLRAPVFPDFAAPKVFGIGLTKTGTSSLGLALDRLGYLQAHFHSPFTHEILNDADFALFDAASDTPVSARFEMLQAQFPNAKFILTERPMTSWVRSFHDHFDRWHHGSEIAFSDRTYAGLKESMWGVDLAMVQGGLYASQADPIASYEAHIRRVERFFADKPAGKLLRHNVFTGDGWAELCAFLGLAVPPEPYPWSNRAPRGLGNVSGRVSD